MSELYNPKKKNGTILGINLYNLPRSWIIFESPK